MQPYLWLWLLLTPPVLALIDLMISPRSTTIGLRERFPEHAEPARYPVTLRESARSDWRRR